MLLYILLLRLKMNNCSGKCIPELLAHCTGPHITKRILLKRYKIKYKGKTEKRQAGFARD
jgi:hypothetical protein